MGISRRGCCSHESLGHSRHRPSGTAQPGCELGASRWTRLRWGDQRRAAATGPAGGRPVDGDGHAADDRWTTRPSSSATRKVASRRGRTRCPKTWIPPRRRRCCTAGRPPGLARRAARRCPREARRSRSRAQPAGVRRDAAGRTRMDRPRERPVRRRIWLWTEAIGSSRNALSIAMVARAALWAGDLEHAARWADRFIDVRVHLPPPRFRERSIAAGIAALRGDVSEAAAQYPHVLDDWRRLGHAYEVALTAIDMASVLDPRSDIVLRAAEEARLILERMGARPMLDRLDAAMARTERRSQPTARWPVVRHWTLSAPADGYRARMGGSAWRAFLSRCEGDRDILRVVLRLARARLLRARGLRLDRGTKAALIRDMACSRWRTGSAT